MHGRLSVYGSRGGKSYRRVTLRIRREKKRGHQHQYVETLNTKMQKVMRCEMSRCKAHFINI